MNNRAVTCAKCLGLNDLAVWSRRRELRRVLRFKNDAPADRGIKVASHLTTRQTHRSSDNDVGQEPVSINAKQGKKRRN